ncbi:MAG: universal stress protein [Saprospiraceae bacterium]
MKNLILPIEKPEEAGNLIQYGFDWADFLKARLVIVHVFRYQKLASSLIDLSDQIKMDLEKELAELVDPISKNYPSDMRYEIKILEGDAAEMILDCAENQKEAMLLLPTKGKSKSERIFLGSVSTSVLEASKVPILAFHPNSKFTIPKKIAFPVDSEGFSSRDTFMPLFEIAEKCSAKIMIFHLENQNEDLGIHPSLDEYLNSEEKNWSLSYHYELSDKPITSAINDFTRDYKANLICLTKRKKSFWEALTQVSITRQELRKKVVPVVVVKG